MPKNTTQLHCIDAIDMKTRQIPLRQEYTEDGSKALVTDHAKSRSDLIPTTNPLYGMVEFNGFENDPLKISLHSGVGGHSDLPVPGDLLCGAIAGCLDSVIRVAANMVGIKLREVEVHVEADVDLRGTLLMDTNVPVGFKDIRINTHIVPEGEVRPALLQAILAAAERSCVVLQTLKNPPKITLNAGAETATGETT